MFWDPRRESDRQIQAALGKYGEYLFFQEPDVGTRNICSDHNDELTDGD